MYVDVLVSVIDSVNSVLQFIVKLTNSDNMSQHFYCGSLSLCVSASCD